MTNMLATLELSLDIPEEVVETLVGRPDDDSDDWYQDACQKVVDAVSDEPPRYMEYVTSESVHVNG